MSSLSALNGLSSLGLSRPVQLHAAGGDDACSCSEPGAAARQADSVEISSEAHNASAADRPLRQGKVHTVKNALAAGEYLHPDKLDIALERLLKDLGV